MSFTGTEDIGLLLLERGRSQAQGRSCTGQQAVAIHHSNQIGRKLKSTGLWYSSTVVVALKDLDRVLKRGRDGGADAREAV